MYDILTLNKISQIGLKELDDKYTVTGLKTVNESATFDDCEYYVLIYSQLTAKSYFEEAKVGDVVTVEGEVISVFSADDYKLDEELTNLLK